MTIHRKTVGEVLVLEIEARLDAASAPALKGVLEELFGRAGCKVVIDMQRVTYISSIGLSALLRGAQLAQAQGGRMVLAGLKGLALEVLQLSGLDNLVDVHSSPEAALASLESTAPRQASGSKRLATGLTLPEEVLLLALRDDDGHFVDLPRHALDFALAGAVLMDLCMQHRIDSDLELLTVVDARGVDDPILDPALAAIARAQEKRPAEHWVGVLAAEAAEIQRRVVERLVERKILRRKDSLLHWALGGRRYPILADREQREIKQRVLGILQHDEIPGPREVAIIALGDACAVFDAILSMDDMLDTRARIAEVARMDLLAQAMRRALREARRSGIRTASQDVYARTADVAS